MRKVKVLTAQQAVELLGNGQTLVTGGFVGNCLPEALNKAVERKFLETGSPSDITLFYAAISG